VSRDQACRDQVCRVIRRDVVRARVWEPGLNGGT
jgi:hypothetical protein